MHNSHHITTKQNNWLIPLLLLALGGINVLLGALQLDTIQQGPPAVPDEFTSMQYFATPIPIVLHIVAGIVFNLLCPFQFASTLRQRWPAWHRWSGRLLLIAGVMVGLTGLWMNHFFPQYGGFLKYSGIVVNSVGLLGSLGLALRVILAGNVQRHRVWMMRAVAFGLGPATQRLFILPYFFIVGMPNDLVIGLVIWFGFLLNLSVVEWVLLRERRRKLIEGSGQRKTNLGNTNLKGAL